MEAYIVGSIARYNTNEQHWIPDGRLLKLCPFGAKNRVLLEIDNAKSGNRYKLYKHRNPDLTKQHKGKFVTVQWIIDFIKANKTLAESLSQQEAEEKEKSIPSQKPEKRHLSAEELKALRSQRNTVDCHCKGITERCSYCYGRGKYDIDGLGKRV